MLSNQAQYQVVVEDGDVVNVVGNPIVLLRRDMVGETIGDFSGRERQLIDFSCSNGSELEIKDSMQFWGVVFVSSMDVFGSSTITVEPI